VARWCPESAELHHLAPLKGLLCLTKDLILSGLGAERPFVKSVWQTRPIRRWRSMHLSRPSVPVQKVYRSSRRLKGARMCQCSERSTMPEEEMSWLHEERFWKLFRSGFAAGPRCIEVWNLTGWEARNSIRIGALIAWTVQNGPRQL
jgi:hypothetical protein